MSKWCHIRPKNLVVQDVTVDMSDVLDKMTLRDYKDTDFGVLVAIGTPGCKVKKLKENSIIHNEYEIISQAHVLIDRIMDILLTK